MKYVREQTSAELAAHIRSLQKMAGWFDPLSDRLWQEVEALQAELAGLKTGYEAYERVNAELKQKVANLEVCQTVSLGMSGIIKCVAGELGFDAAGEDSAQDYLIGLARRASELKAENEALRKDKDRLDALESNFWDVRHDSHPIADTGDSSSSLEIVGHWMDKPFERVIGEDWNENLRAAIDQAMKAPAYPPARPEYPEFDDIPDFSPGNGNSARRRSASLGIDYDAAMGQGELS